MKRARKWVDRVSLSVFVISSLYIYLTLDQFPEAQNYENTGEALIAFAYRVFF